MRITFVSNYINHHQIPIAEELYRLTNGEYRFIQTSPMEADRIRQGWAEDFSSLPYLLLYDENPQECKQRISESEIVIFGGVEDESYIAPRIKAGKIVLRYSERLYREGQWKAISPRGLIKKYHDHTRHRKAPVYLLCSGGYVADDFEIIKAYRGKRFRWGYFTQFEKISDEDFSRYKQGNIVRILWAGRFLTLKHSMDVLVALLHLKRKGIPFEMQFVGGGECETQMRDFIRRHGMENEVKITGFLKPAQVREEMKKAHIYLFTSDYREGWGAVVNEAMNSGCAVVVSHAVGAAPFLIKHGANGLIYKSGDIKALTDCIERLCKDSKLRQFLGKNAYKTIEQEWNPKEAADRLFRLCETLLRGEISFEKTGPLSEAEVIRQPKMYEYLTGKK